MPVSTENVQQWGDLTKDTRCLEEKYHQDNLEYKDIARQAFTDEMGFESPLEASMMAEYCHRATLKCFDEGATTKKKLQEALIVRSLAVKSNLVRSFPE
ncbi:MAG: hypothetical protein Roseis2KO_07270 [Roseivirga sp.]